jgi:Uma2 family endonuclease
MAAAKNLSYYPPLSSNEFPRKYTVEEYFEIEAKLEEKLDYVNGYIVKAKIDISHQHSLISTNIMIALHNLLKDKPYQTLGSGMRIKTANSFRFPDALVLSKNPAFYNEKQTTLLNPTVLVEVVSPESIKHDYTRKRLEYFTIESLVYYIIVEQNMALVSVFSKTQDNVFLVSDYDCSNPIIVLPNLKISLNLEDIYDDVDFM